MTVAEPVAGGADRRPQCGHDDGFGHGSLQFDGQGPESPTAR
jgi:hypothetical protein